MIGSIIDPRQHTATVIGWVPNALVPCGPAN